jgi:hypothetical protein
MWSNLDNRSGVPCSASLPFPKSSPCKRLCCKFQKQTSLLPSVCRAFLGCQGEKAVDKLNLSKKIISCHPSSLSLPDHMDGFVALNRSPSPPGILGSPAWHSLDV